MKFVDRPKGYTAEQALKRWCIARDRRWIELGFRDVEESWFWKLPPQLRYLPDFILDDVTLVEAKGVGRDQIIKIKTENLKYLSEIHVFTHMPTHMFIYDSVRDLCAWILLDDLLTKDMLTPYERDFFDNGTKEYIKIPTDDNLLTWGYL